MWRGSSGGARAGACASSVCAELVGPLAPLHSPLFLLCLWFCPSSFPSFLPDSVKCGLQSWAQGGGGLGGQSEPEPVAPPATGDNQLTDPRPGPSAVEPISDPFPRPIPVPSQTPAFLLSLPPATPSPTELGRKPPYERAARRGFRSSLTRPGLPCMLQLQRGRGVRAGGWSGPLAMNVHDLGLLASHWASWTFSVGAFQSGRQFL